jgi:hypothetical protein
MGNSFLMRGEDPGILDPFKEIGESLWETYDYFHTEAEFAQINNTLSQIQQQITVLQSDVSQLSNQLNITTNELSNLDITIVLNQYIVDIQNAMDSTTITGLQYFPRRAAQFKAGQITLSQFQTDTANLRLFAYSVYHNSDNMDVTDWAKQLNMLLFPDDATAALMPLANLIIQKMTNANLTDSVSVLNAYILLESYFLQVVNAQFQCATLYTNADIFYNPADTAAPTAWFTDTFTTYITKEVKSYLTVVDYLMVNLDDYRSQQRFVSDMQYANAGLAPDNITFHSLARSRFVAKLLFGAVGLNSPVVNGHIILPATYATIGNAAISVNVNNTILDTTPTQIPGQIPYALWVDGNPAICHPDNKWNVYTFGTLGKSDGTWATTSQPFQVVASGTQDPWVHFVPSQGTITPKYYNPQFPNQTSPTKTSECTVEFAYFSASWKWGFLQLTNTQLTDNWVKSNKPVKDQFFDFSTYNSSLVENSANVPFAATTNTWQCTYQTGGITWTDPYGTTGTMQMSGTLNQTSHYYVIVDGNYLNVTTGSELPATSGTIQAWAWYMVNYTMKGSGGDDLTVAVGTTRKFTENDEGGPDFATIGDDVVRNNWHDLAGTTWNSGFGTSANLQANTSYQPGIQYYYQTFNLSYAVPASISLVSGFQFVYGGYYALPSK